MADYRKPEVVVWDVRSRGEYEGYDYPWQPQTGTNRRRRSSRMAGAGGRQDAPAQARVGNSEHPGGLTALPLTNVSTLIDRRESVRRTAPSSSSFWATPTLATTTAHGPSGATATTPPLRYKHLFLSSIPHKAAGRFVYKGSHFPNEVIYSCLDLVDG